MGLGKRLIDAHNSKKTLHTVFEVVKRTNKSVGSQFELTPSPVDIARPHFKKLRPVFRQTFVPKCDVREHNCRIR